MAVEADPVGRLSQLSVVGGAVGIMARGTGDTTPVHDALRRVVPLHTVLVGRAVGKIIEVGLAQSAVFVSPEIGSFEAHVVADWPIVVLPFDRLDNGCPCEWH